MYRFGIFVCRVLVALSMKRRIIGMEHVPTSGALMIISNHLGLIDPAAIGTELPRRLYILGKAEMFAWPVIGRLIRSIGSIPVRRGQADREAIRLLLEHLAAGHAILMFPEGTYPKGTRGMLRAQPGAALLALKSRTTILPIAIVGSDHVWNKRELPWCLFRRWPVTVTVGEPYQPTIPANVSQKQALAAITEEMMQHIAALLPEAYRGVYATALAAGQSAALAGAESASLASTTSTASTLSSERPERQERQASFTRLPPEEATGQIMLPLPADE